ncbi:MAG: hypothetical protein JW728_04095 [Candidatus Aureabacteria bacterium]|nr:hypothetical protein [Candidatus Auribacterota bacterium]
MCTENSCELKEKIGPEPVLNEEPLLRTPEEDRTDEMTKPAGLEKIKQTNKTPGNDPYDSWE